MIRAVRGRIEIPARPAGGAALAWGGLLASVWPGLIQAQARDPEARKAFSGLAPDPLQSLQASNYILGIVIVFATLAVASWLLRRYQPQAGRGLIKIQASLSLGGKDRLMVVEVQGRRLLLGVGSAGIRQLQVLDSGPDSLPDRPGDTHSPQPGSPHTGTGSWLRKVLKPGPGT